MPRRCCVKGCDSNQHRDVYTNVLSLPKDPVTRNKWLALLNKKNVSPKDNMSVCIKHFDPQDLLKIRMNIRSCDGGHVSQKFRYKLKDSSVCPKIFPLTVDNRSRSIDPSSGNGSSSSSGCSSEDGDQRTGGNEIVNVHMHFHKKFGPVTYLVPEEPRDDKIKDEEKSCNFSDEKVDDASSDSDKTSGFCEEFEEGVPKDEASDTLAKSLSKVQTSEAFAESLSKAQTSEFTESSNTPPESVSELVTSDISISSLCKDESLDKEEFDQSKMDFISKLNLRIKTSCDESSNGDAVSNTGQLPRRKGKRYCAVQSRNVWRSFLNIHPKDDVNGIPSSTCGADREHLNSTKRTNPHTSSKNAAKKVKPSDGKEKHRISESLPKNNSMASAKNNSNKTATSNVVPMKIMHTVIESKQEKNDANDEVIPPLKIRRFMIEAPKDRNQSFPNGSKPIITQLPPSVVDNSGKLQIKKISVNATSSPTVPQMTHIEDKSRKLQTKETSVNAISSKDLKPTIPQMTCIVNDSNKSQIKEAPVNEINAKDLKLTVPLITCIADNFRTLQSKGTLVNEISSKDLKPTVPQCIANDSKKSQIQGTSVNEISSKDVKLDVSRTTCVADKSSRKSSIERTLISEIDTPTVYSNSPPRKKRRCALNSITTWRNVLHLC